MRLHILILTCLLLGFLSLPNAGYAISWTGQGQTNSWSDPGNWSGNQVPGAGDLATVGNGYTPYIDYAVTVGVLVLDNVYLHGPGSVTVTASFSADSSNVAVPLTLIQGTAGLLTGYYLLSADLTNYGEITCNANITFYAHTIINHGIFNAASGYGFGVYYSPARFYNHGIFKKPYPAGTFTAGVELTNYSDGDIVAESGELNISGNLFNHGDVIVSSGASVRNHEVHAQNGSTITGAGTFIINGNGFFAENSSPISIDIAELELDGQQIGGTGAVTITQHLNWISGGIQTAVTFSPTCIVDVNTSGGHGITNTTTNNGIMNVNANMTFSTGTLVNNNLLVFNGANSIGIYNASAGIFNHGTVQKPAGQDGLFSLNLPLTNESDGALLVQDGELYVGQLENSGNIIVSADAVLRTHTFHLYDGATLTGGGLLKIRNNGLFADNTSPISIEIAETELDAQQIGGTGSLSLSGHLVWLSGALATTVQLTSSSVVDVNPGGSGAGITGLVTNNGVMNINANMTFSYGNLTNNGLILLNGPHSIGIYAGTQGIFNYGTVQKPAGSAGLFNMGIPLTNHPGGSVIVENGELYVNSNYNAYSSLSVSAGAVFRAHNTQVFDGASFSGAGTIRITGNGLTANNTATVIFDIASAELEASCSGSGTLHFNGLVSWEAGYLNNPIVIGSNGTLDVNLTANYGNGGNLTVNGTLNANSPFFNNGTIFNNGALHLNVTGGIGGGGTINNTGLLIKELAAGTAGIDNFLQNSGTVQCPGDNLNLTGLANAGTIEVSGGATVQLSGYGANSFDAGCVITGQGTFILAANITVTANLNIGIQTFVLDGFVSGTGNLTFTNTFNWQGGLIENSVTISTGAVMNVMAGNAKSLYGMIVNEGAVNCDDNLEFAFSGIFDNNGIFNLNGDNTLGSPYSYYNSGQINNAGTFGKNSAGTAFMNLLFHNLNTGTLQVVNGTLESGKLDNDGSVDIASGALLIVKDGNNLTNGTLSGNGAIRISLYGWTIENTLTIAGLSLEIDANLYGAPGASLNIQGTASWLSGDISVPVNVAASGTLHISGYGYRVLQATLDNAGTVNCGTSFSAGANIINQGNLFLTDGGGFFGSGGQTFTNSGLLQMNGSYDSYIDMVVINTGTIDVTSSTLHLFSGLENNAAAIVQNGATLEIGGSSVFNTGSSLMGAGNLSVSGGELALNIGLTFSGGTFSLSGDLLGPNDLTVNTAMTWSYGDIETDVTIASGATLDISGNGGGGGGYGSKGYGKLFFHSLSSGQTLSAIITNNGTTTQNGSYYMDGGTFTNNGQLGTSYGGLFDDGNGGTFTNNGSWSLEDGFECFVNAVNNGTLTGDGYLTFEPEWENNGIVSPGFSPGQMTFAHNYENGSALQIEMDNNGGPGVGHDYILAEENIQVGGTLNVTETGSLLNGVYTILHCNGGANCLTGTFATVNLPADYSLSYTGSDVKLTKGTQQVSITPADPVICAGNTVTLTASNADSYLWSTGETTASIEVAPYYTETYSVTVTFPGGVGAFGSATVTVNPQPYVYIDPYYAFICQGESITLTAYGGDTYTWSTGQSGSSIAVVPQSYTEYYVTATDANGCTGTSATYIYTGDPAAIPEITGVPAAICQNEQPIVLPDIQDGFFGEWSGPGVSYNTFDPAGLSGGQMLTFTPFTYQCAAPASWTIEVNVSTDYYLDSDNDGYGDPAASTTACTQPAGYVADNTDCDDDNAGVNPGATETCNGIDDDCDGLTDEGLGSTWYADNDNDGYGDATATTTACTQPAGYVADNTDCDDDNAGVNPGATETCNGIDDDCDGLTDEGLGSTWYADNDNDGYGDATATTTACTQPAGYVADNTDCDDDNAGVNPGATETCNGIDDDCDGLTDEGLGSTWYADNDNDGYGDAASSTTACTQPVGYVADNTDCDDDNAGVNPGATETCNGIDDDCDGLTDEGLGSTWYADNDNDGYGDATATTTACTQPAGYVADNTDCDDDNAGVNPGATETCNGIDDDCDGLTDEGLGSTWYADNDNDGYGDAASSTTACTQPAGYVADNTDCDDDNAGVNPGATETCNGIDDDCDGLTDEGLGSTWYADNDNDGYGDATATTTACTQPAGYVADNTDCDDDNAGVNPGATETCNGIDDDCDGLTDEGLGSTWYADNDNDGYGDAASSTTACTQPAGYVADNTDCDDDNAGVNPGATETCNGIDDDCDGLTDEGLGSTWYADNDNDGYGDAASSTTACTQPAGYVADNTDCDDANSERHPNATEVCNNIDDDCDGQIDETSGIVIDPVIVTHVTCSGGNTGSIDISVNGGAAPYSYHWSNNKTTQDIMNLSAGVYTVTVTDAGGCTATTVETVNPKLKLTLNKTNTTCNGGSDGTATATVTGGTPPYTYEWETGATTPTITGLTPGSYGVTIMDALNCTRSGSIGVGQPPAIGITGQTTAVSCNGGANGSINITVNNGTSPFTFEWSDGGNTEDRTGLGAGSYTVTVSDVNGCTREKSFSVSQPSALTLSFSKTDVSCNGAADGEITATANGGVKYPTNNLCNDERYCYAWDNGATTRLLENLEPNPYTLTVTDLNGCTITGSAAISEPEPLVITQIEEEELPNGKYKLTITAAGGVTPYKYKRIPGGGSFQTSNIFNNVPAGNYQIIVRDKNLCEYAVNISVPGAGNFQSGDAEARQNQVPEFETTNEVSGLAVTLFPNPATERFNLFIDTEFTSGIIQIYDLGGRLILEESLLKDVMEYQFDVNGWQSGVYFIRIQMDGRRSLRKLIVETR